MTPAVAVNLLPRAFRPCNASACTYAIAEGKSGNTNANQTQETAAPLVVLIHSRECPVCARVRPVLKDLQTSYEPRVRFVNLDVTDDKTKAESKALAKSLHVGAFFNLYSDSFPCVGIFDSKSRSIRELCGFNSKEKYDSYIKRALEKS